MTDETVSLSNEPSESGRVAKRCERFALRRLDIVRVSSSKKWSRSRDEGLTGSASSFCPDAGAAAPNRGVNPRPVEAAARPTPPKPREFGVMSLSSFGPACGRGGRSGTLSDRPPIRSSLDVARKGANRSWPGPRVGRRYLVPVPQSQVTSREFYPSSLTIVQFTMNPEGPYRTPFGPVISRSSARSAMSETSSWRRWRLRRMASSVHSARLTSQRGL